MQTRAAVGAKIGSNVRIGDGAHLTSFSASTTSAVLSNGNVVFAWQDQGFDSYATSVDGTLGGVFFKVFAQDGSVVQGTTMPYSNSAHQNGPKLAALADGGFAIGWENGTASSSSSAIVDSYVRVYNNSGVAVSSPVLVNDVASTTVDLQQEIDSIVPLPNGNFFANLRHDERGASPNQDDNLIQLFNGTTGAKIGSNVRIGDGAHLTSFSASTTSAVLSNGNVVFAWQDQGFDSYATSVDGTLGGVFFKVFAQDGSVVQGTTMPYSNSAHQNGPKLAALAGGGFAIGWENGTASSSSTAIVDSYVRVYNNSGVAVSSPVLVNDAASTTVDLQQEIDSIVPLQNGNFFANLRHDERGASPNQDDNLIQLFNGTTGAKIGSNVRIGDGAHLTSFSASTTSAVLSNGNVVFAWQDQGFDSYATSVDGTLGGVFFKVFAQDGSVVQGTTMPYSNSAHQNGPKLAALAGGGFAIGWENGTASSSSTAIVDSYVRVYNNSGVAVSLPVLVNDAASTTVDLQQEIDSIVPLQNGNFFANLRHDERGASPNQDDNLIQLFEGPPVASPGTTVASIARKDGNPTNAGTVRWDVTFAASVTNVSSSNFALAQSGVSGALVTGVTGSGIGWVVTASTGSGSGTLGLNLANNTGIAPTVSNAPFTGDVYTIDKTPPVLTVVGSLVIGLECGVDTWTDPGSSAVDAVDGTVTVMIGGDTVDASTSGTYNVTYNTSDSVGNSATQVTRVVTVSDTSAPVITLTAPNPVTIECSVDTYSEPGFSASDLCDGNLTSSVIVAGDTVNASMTGIYNVTYNVMDVAGNAAMQVVRVVNVVDTTAPVITLTAPNPVTIECSVDTYSEPGFSATDLCDGNLAGSVAVAGDTVDESTTGTYNITYNVMDAAGNAATQAVRVVNVVDTLPPVISGSTKDIVVSAPANTSSDPISYTFTASDICDPSVPVVCVPPSGSTFPIGVNPVTCTATDSSSNTVAVNFNVIVLEIAVTPHTRILDAVALRGDTPAGAPATLLSINRGFLNNSGTILFSSSLSGGGEGVFLGPVAGPHSAIAIKGTPSGSGAFGNFDNLTLNDSDDAGFQSRLVTGPAHYLDGAASAAAAQGLIAAAVPGSPIYRSLQKPALAANGDLLTRANLVIGSGAGVTSADDTVTTSSSGALIAREGDATSIGGGVLYSGLSNRIVASENNNHYAFSSNLKPVSSLTNSALFVDVLSAPNPAAVVREGDSADGTPGVFSSFLGEAVNSDGEVALRGTARGAGISSTNNEGIWTNSGNTGAAPFLVAREGDDVPCLPAAFLGLVAFDRFTTIAIADDGSVCFFAYLKNATAAPVVNSTSDGSIWRWTSTGLHLIAREGVLANNTDGALIGRLNTFACSSTGIVYQVEYVQNAGDTTTANRDGIYLDRGLVDPAPELILRRGDKFDLMGISRTVSSLKISTEENTGGGTGGYGRAINDMGSVLLNLSLSGNLSGIFILSPGP